MTQIRRYVEVPNPRRLGELLSNPDRLTSEPIGIDADLDEFDRMAEQGLSGDERSKADALMAVSLHKAFNGQITLRDASDMKVWHWFAVASRPALVWRRWTGQVPLEPEQALTASLKARFLGAPTLNGVSRNTFARLWWCAETLRSGSDYSLAVTVLQKQDLFQAVFERRFGLHRPAAVSFITQFADKGEQRWRDAAKRLDYRLSTVVLETLAEKEIGELVEAVGA
jgi:uncharacterized protein DUF6339